MIGSSLRGMRNRLTVNVYSRTLSPTYSETIVYTGLTATREQRDAYEQMSETGAIITITDVFWFEPVNGVLPVINEGHLLTCDSVRYEVLQVMDQGGGNSRLRVMTRRLRNG